ncbi:MAG TPA: phosphatidylglycerophosphatase A [Mucilaginibacter sp.]|nr:phosphatidylglycerophosphatase A [Mucilaginibacter sp.]
MLFHKLTSTCLGIGYIGKGAGTVAALACCVCWYLAWAGGFPPALISLAVTVFITLLGIWSSGLVSHIWGKDPSRVVIDEAAGMCITLLFIPVNIVHVLAGLVLFRFFDIAKPFFIKRMERLPGGWGIMLDDVLAGIYANVLLQAVVWFKI